MNVPEYYAVCAFLVLLNMILMVWLGDKKLEREKIKKIRKREKERGMRFLIST